MSWKNFITHFFSKRKTKRGLLHKKEPGRRNASSEETTEADTYFPITGKGELGTDLASNIEQIKTAFGRSDDLVVREIETATSPPLKMALFLIDGLVDDLTVTESVLTPLLASPAEPFSEETSPATFFETAKKTLLRAGQVSETTTFEEIFNGLSSGITIILVEKHNRALLASTQGWKERGIEEPATEAVVRGPRDSFAERLRGNTALLRLRLKSPRLRIEEFQIGELTKTKIALAYIQNIASEKLLQEVKDRLKRIKTAGILESGYLEEFIEDEPLSPFPQLLRSERPDRVTACLLEGKVAILTDGTPFVLLVPAFFTEFLTTPEDYYERYFIGSFIRLIRYAAFTISLVLPSIYVAIITFHQEMLPTPLILSIASQREGVPFPTFVEALLLELTFEILREAGLRLPRVIGQAVSIVGVIIIGQAAVEAGLVSQFMLIVVALTAIASFATPVFSLAITMRLLRFALLFLASALGFFGVLAGIYIILLHLVSLRSYGFPYLKPLGPVMASDLKDTIIRVPMWAMHTRPRLVVPDDRIRQKKDLKPQPPAHSEKTNDTEKGENAI
ncbi:MAG: spore germination protein [Firmicutes bacterium]|nr:spore germination protein [Bacillota bacterium]